MYFLWSILGKLLGFSVFLALDTLISISGPLRTTGGRLMAGFQLLRLKSLKHAPPNVYLAGFFGSMDTFTRLTDVYLVVSYYLLQGRVLRHVFTVGTINAK